MKKSGLLVVAATFVLLTSGCAQRLLDFTVISTKNVDLSGKFVKGKERVKASDTKHMVLFFSTGRPNIKAAVDKAIEKIPGCVALENGVLRSSVWSVLLYGQQKYIIEGDPLILKDDMSSGDIEKDDFEYIIAPDNDNNFFSIK